MHTAIDLRGKNIVLKETIDSSTTNLDNRAAQPARNDDGSFVETSQSDEREENLQPRVRPSVEPGSAVSKNSFMGRGAFGSVKNPRANPQKAKTSRPKVSVEDQLED